MNIGLSTRSVQKAGNPEEENDDWVGARRTGNRIRAAVADGATEATFSDLWAESLVTAWLSSTAVDISQAVLSNAREAWASRLPPTDSMPWYAQAKLEEGSFAALAGVEVRIRRGRAYWTASIVGDCEMFLLKRSRRLWLRRAEPAKLAGEFGYHPELLATSTQASRHTAPRTFNGRVRAPFELWIASDAFAEACLSAYERSEPSWDYWSAALESDQAFRAAVDAARETGELRNDDTTVCRLRAE